MGTQRDRKSQSRKCCGMDRLILCMLVHTCVNTEPVGPMRGNVGENLQS